VIKNVVKKGVMELWHDAPTEIKRSMSVLHVKKERLRKSWSKCMKIGVLSDTHTKAKRSQENIEMLLAQGAEFLIHAGDIGEIETLEQLKHSGVGYVAVYGNNDAHLHSVHNRYNLVQEPHYFKLAHTKFKMMHLPFYMTPDSEVVIFGHTHAFECDFKNGTLFLNPGETCARNKDLMECAMLEVTDSHFNVTYYTKKTKEKHHKEKHFSFERVK
jgi:putative phosphoesterase